MRRIRPPENLICQHCRTVFSPAPDDRCWVIFYVNDTEPTIAIDKASISEFPLCQSCMKIYYALNEKYDAMKTEALREFFYPRMTIHIDVTTAGESNEHPTH